MTAALHVVVDFAVGCAVGPVLFGAGLLLRRLGERYGLVKDKE